MSTATLAREPDTLINRLQAQRSGNGWKARCPVPAHNDQKASLSIGLGDNGGIVLNCFAGCPVEAIVASIGLTMRDLMPASNGHAKPTAKKKAPAIFAFAKDALAAYERKLGPHSQHWEYHDAAGNIVGAIVRWDTPTGKEIRPISKHGSGCVMAGMTPPRPLYDLHLIQNERQVNVGEGEKVCEAGKSIGLVFTTSPHGAKSVDEADWTPLAGKDAAGFADNDGPGRKYIDDVGRILWDLSPRTTLRIVTLPGLAEGEDLVDWINHHGDSAEPESMREEIEALIQAAKVWTPPPDSPAPATPAAAPKQYLIVEPGIKLWCMDRTPPNIGTVNADNGSSCNMHFDGEEGAADKEIDKPLLMTMDGRRLDGSGPTIPEPCSATQLIQSHPRLRPAAIHGLLRIGETMNVVADPKRGKSWLVNGLTCCKASGTTWLTFECDPGRVLIIDGELHPEVIAYRLPLVADAMGVDRSVLDSIDVLPLRGCGVDLLTLQPFVESIEPGRYALVILDAWYRFLPPGFSENDNAQVMALYNKIDGYTAHLQSAWVNVHHASKGDQSGKSTTDVGSGAGSQSRAADTHLIIRPHELDDVAVVEAVVRSWPPVEPLAIRWTYPVWQLDSADPRKLRRPRDKATRESSDIHLDEDRQAIVNAMTTLGKPETRTIIRNATRVRDPRFGFAWTSLVIDKTITSAGDTKKANGQRYDVYVLAPQEPE